MRLEHTLVPMSVSHVSECPDIGPECFGPNRPVAYNHHIDQILFETALSANLGLTEFLAVETRWALRVADVNPTYSELDGTPREDPDNIHHHEQTLVDFTDPTLTFVLSELRGIWLGQLRLGTTFPLGRTEPNPYVLGRQGEAHQHLQAGTGTFVPTVGLSLAALVDPVTISVSGHSFLSSYENSRGYQAPSRVFVTSRVSLNLLEGMLRPHVGLDLGHETDELWNGDVGSEASGARTELFGSTGLAYRFVDPWSVDLGLRTRIARLTDVPSFEVPVIVSLGLSTSFDIWTKEEAAAKPEPDAEGVVRSEKDGVITFEK